MILVNGTAADSIPASDRGLAYGDGVFRTLRAANGKPLHWTQHYARLVHDCAQLALPCPDELALRNEAVRAGAAHPNAAIKIIVTRGSAPRGYAPPRSPIPLRVVLSSPYQPQAAEEGIQAHLCKLRLSHQPALAGVKHLNRLENVLARAEWQAPEIREGLLLDHDGNAIGGTMSNLFIVEDGALLTPDLSSCGVAGVTRDRVMAIAQTLGLACHVENCTLQRLRDANEVFFVNSLIGLWPLRRLEQRLWRAGEYSRQIQVALASGDAECT